nr:uncharacterized protein LOC111501919 [Leptinotarsa decemlineata]
MEFNKYVIKGKYSETTYWSKSELIDDKNCELLGFRDCLPVLCGNMNESKNSSGIKKTLKIEVNSDTGEKYINLNGKKIKIIPESELPNKLPKNAQVRKIASLNSITEKPPIKVKVLKAVPLKNSTAQYVSNGNTSSNEGKQMIEISKINLLSQKTLIRESASTNVKTLSGNVTIKANTADQNSDMLKSVRKPVINTFKIDSKNKSSGSGQNVIALDLTKYSLNQGRKIESSTQTDKNIVDACVQTDDEILFTDFDILEIMKDLPYLEPIPKAHDNLDNTLISSKNLHESNGQSHDSNNVNNLRAKNFFNELRTALQPDDRGNMPIHLGVLRNDLTVVKRSWFILKILNQSVDLPNSNDYTALQLAIMNDSSEDIIAFLLSKQASLSVTDSEGNNVLHLAIEYQRTDALKTLLDHAYKVKFNLDQHNHEGLTSLMICCLNGQDQCAKLLLEYKADINVRDQISGRTALFHAAECHDSEMVQLLLRHHADTKLKNFFGTSPHDAMYEIDDIPDQIKSMILSKNNKRKVFDDPRPLKIRKEETINSKTNLRTYAKLQKIGQTELGKKLLTSVK